MFEEYQYIAVIEEEYQYKNSPRKHHNNTLNVSILKKKKNLLVIPSTAYRMHFVL